MKIIISSSFEQAIKEQVYFSSNTQRRKHELLHKVQPLNHLMSVRDNKGSVSLAG